MKSNSMAEIPTIFDKKPGKIHYRRVPIQASSITSLRPDNVRESGRNLKKTLQTLAEISCDYSTPSIDSRPSTRTATMMSSRSPKVKLAGSNIPSLTSTCASESQNKDELSLIKQRSLSPIVGTVSDFTSTLCSPTNAGESAKKKVYCRKDRGLLATLVSPLDSERDESLSASKSNKLPTTRIKKRNTGVMFTYDLWSDKQFKACVNNTGLSLQTGEKVLTEGLTFRDTKEIFKNIYSRRHRKETQHLRHILRGDLTQRTASPLVPLNSNRSVTSLGSGKSLNVHNSTASNVTIAVHDQDYYNFAGSKRGYTKALTLQPKTMIDTSYQNLTTRRECDISGISTDMEQNLKGAESYFSWKGVKQAGSCNSPAPFFSMKNLNFRKKHDEKTKEVFKQNISNILNECENYQLDKSLQQQISQHRLKLRNKRKEASMVKCQEVSIQETLRKCQIVFEEKKRIQARNLL